MSKRETEVLYTSMCGDVTTCNSCLNFKLFAMKWWAPNWLKSSAISGHLIFWVLSSVQGLFLSTQWSENRELLRISASKSGDPSVGTSQASVEILLISFGWLGESPEVSYSFRPKFLPAATHCCELLLVQGLLYVYYAVRYAVWLLAFLDTNRGLLLTVKALQKMQCV